MHKFLIVFESVEGGYSAYSPDLPGCIAAGPTLEETQKNIGEAVQIHLAGMVEDGEVIPESRSVARTMTFPEGDLTTDV